MYTVSLLLLFLKMKRPCKFKNGKKKLAIYFNCVSVTFVQKINGLALYWKPN